jgi:asparagine synthetase B (glutamine-hydrolysing)
MISTSIVSDTPAADWIDTEAGWQSGPNLISLIDNCCLKRAMLVADGGLIFVVAEQSLDLPSLSTRTRKQVLSAFAHNLTGDGLLIYISDTRRVTLVRTAHATIPLYVSAEADRLNVSWDYHAVVAARGAVVLSRSELRYFILYGPQLAQETIVIGVKQLFAGQSASWSAGQTEIEIDPMIECESLEQSVLRPGAHVTAGFVDLINLSCRAVLQHAARPALELSGGMDSSSVAVALKAAERPFLSYALLHDGNAGHKQKLR